MPADRGVGDFIGRQVRPTRLVAREAIENYAPQSLEDLKPFEASVQQALAELSTMLNDAG